MNSERLKECAELSAEILKNFECSDIPIKNIILKCLRLCRLLGDTDGALLFTYEASGYPSSPEGLDQETWRIAKIAGRIHKEKDIKTSNVKEYAKIQLIGEMEETITDKRVQLSNSVDPNIAISSANPNQFILVPSGNSIERKNIVETIADLQKWIHIITGHLYNYILQIYNRLTYGNIIEDTFTNSRLMANKKLTELCPKSIEKFIAVYNNMDSDNPEDWANAVHSCRRILLDLADVLYPAREEPVVLSDGKQIRVGKEQYVNRLIQFIDGKNGSQTFKEVVGADLSSIGKRLDAIYGAANKGTHDCVTKPEAARYIIHTYLLISDIIALI